MKKMQMILCLLACILLNSACGKDKDLHNNIKFFNNSENNVYVYAEWWFPEYPDTSIYFSNPTLSDNIYKVTAKSSGDPLKIRDTYEGRFQPQEKIMVFVFDARILETIPWDTITANYIVLKRYDLNLEDLNKLNWTISYP